MLKTKIPSSQEVLLVILGESQDDNPRLTAQRDKHLISPQLIEAGFIRTGSFITHYDCDCCASSGEVVWRENRKTGGKIATFRCECGLNDVTPDELRTWDVVILILVQRIGEAMGFSLPFTEVVPSIVWSFGRKMRREFYYIRRIKYKENPTVKAFFTLRPTAVLIVPTNYWQKKLGELMPENPCFSVESIAAMDEPCQLQIDMKSIEAEVEPVQEKSKCRHVKRGNRAANIEKLTAEMKEHYRASKDHYYAAHYLLPRPTQAELAKRVGIRQDDVSRCLNDPDAMLFQILWKQADDIRYVLNS